MFYRKQRKWYTNYRSSCRLSLSQKKFLDNFNDESFNTYCIENLYNEVLLSNKKLTIVDALILLNVY
jgi:hypothetical protein